MRVASSMSTRPASSRRAPGRRDWRSLPQKCVRAGPAQREAERGECPADEYAEGASGESAGQRGGLVGGGGAAGVRLHGEARGQHGRAPGEAAGGGGGGQGVVGVPRAGGGCPRSSAGPLGGPFGEVGRCGCVPGRVGSEVGVGGGADAFGGAAVAAETGQQARASAHHGAGRARTARAQYDRAGRGREDRHQRKERERGGQGQRLVRGEEAGRVAVEGEAGQIAAQVQEEQQRDHRAERAGHGGGDGCQDHQLPGSQTDRREPGPGAGGRVGPGDGDRELHGGRDRREAPGEPEHGRRGRVRVPQRVSQGAQEQETGARGRRGDEEPAELDGGVGPAD